MIEIRMVETPVGLHQMYSIHTIEAGEVIGSEAFGDDFMGCAEATVEQMLENGMTDEQIEMGIIGMLKVDRFEVHTRFILDLLKQHYLDLEEMGR